jgi:DNA methylase/ParB-like nuclease domain
MGMSELEPVQQNSMIPITSLFAHSRNFRSHPPEQVKKLKASLERWGQVRSIVAQVNTDGTYTIVAGHGLVQAAQELAAFSNFYYQRFCELRVDVIPASWSSEQVSGYLVADNNLSNDAVDDSELLAQLLSEQADAGYDLASLGTDDETLRQMLESLGDEYVGGGSQGDGGDEYDVDPDAVEVRCKRGELWQLGEHRLLVDDSTNPDNVKRLMNGENAVLMATDPPYGDSWVQKAKDMQAHGYVHSHAGLHGSIESDDLNVTDLKAFLMKFLEAAKLAGDPPMPFYVWHRAKRIVFETALVESGYFVHQPVVWVKPGFVIGRLHYHPRCEWALHGWRQGNGICSFYGERNQSDVWEVARENDKIHPTQKPLMLFDTPILNHTKEGEICYEPFAGSGTCLISAERLNRKCYAMELDERYASVIIDRWETETGQQATLLERVEEVAHA